MAYQWRRRGIEQASIDGNERASKEIRDHPRNIRLNLVQARVEVDHRKVGTDSLEAMLYVVYGSISMELIVEFGFNDRSAVVRFNKVVQREFVLST